MKPETRRKSGTRKNWRKNEIKNELDEIKKWEEKIKRKDLIDRTNKYKYDFQ